MKHLRWLLLITLNFNVFDYPRFPESNEYISVGMEIVEWVVNFDLEFDLEVNFQFLLETLLLWSCNLLVVC